MTAERVAEDYTYEWDNPATQPGVALPWVVRQYGVAHPVARFATVMLAREYCAWRNAAMAPRLVYDCRWCEKSFETFRGVRTHEAAVHHGLPDTGRGKPGNARQRSSYHALRNEPIAPRNVADPRPAWLDYTEQGG